MCRNTQIVDKIDRAIIGTRWVYSYRDIDVTNPLSRACLNITHLPSVYVGGMWLGGRDGVPSPLTQVRRLCSMFGTLYL